jgi:hypothetical protein
MNKIDSSLKIVSLSIDSLFRDKSPNTSSSSFILNLPEPIENVLSMKITSVEIPNFLYMFSSEKRNNEFIITTYNYKFRDNNNDIITVPSSTYIIVFPEGNYLNIDFVNLINAYFINVGGGLDYIILEIDVNTGKTIFRARHQIDDALLPAPYDITTPFFSDNFYFSLDFRVSGIERPIYMNMGWTLGYTKDFYLVSYEKKSSTLFIPNKLITTNNNITFNSFCKSESSYGSSIYNYFFLDLEDNNKNFTSDEILSYLPNSYLQGNNIIARITLHTSPNSINFTTASDCISKTRNYYGSVKINRLNIRLIDRFGYTLDLNGNDFSFLIEFTTSV